MTANENIPWKRLSVEAAAIVGSILLAFAIDAWWTERQENAREKRQIQALITEFEGNRSQVKVDLEGLRGITSNLQELTNKLSSVSVGNDVEVSNRYLWAIRQGGIADPSTGTLDAMISSGDLGLLQNELLRSALSDWLAKLDEVRADQQTLRTFTAGELVPYLGTLGDFSGLVLARSGDKNAPEILWTIQSTGRLRTSVAYKLLMSRIALGKLEILVAKTESIIDLLRQSQNDTDP